MQLGLGVPSTKEAWMGNTQVTRTCWIPEPELQRISSEQEEPTADASCGGHYGRIWHTPVGISEQDNRPKDSEMSSLLDA